MAKLFICYGLPGAGKSTFSSFFADTHDCIRISADEVRDQENLPWSTTEEILKIFERVCEMAEENLSEGKSVIIDATFIIAEYREFLKDVCSIANSSEGAYLLKFIVARETLKDRANQREVEAKKVKDPNSRRFSKQLKNGERAFTTFSDSELKMFHGYVGIDSGHKPPRIVSRSLGCPNEILEMLERTLRCYEMPKVDHEGREKGIER